MHKFSLGNIGKKEIRLKVPFYSQFEKDNGLDRRWQERSCGILALRMIFDYYRTVQGAPLVNLQQLLSDALELGGVDKHHNWYHATLVRTARHYGFLAWRRSWIPSQRDVDWFKKEGASELSIKAWHQQLKEEAVYALSLEIVEGHPVVVSASPYFGEEQKAHLMVLSGLRKDSNGNVEGFYYQDPYDKTQGPKKERYVSLEQFMKAWTFRAVFVHPGEQ
ncbi:MAG: C39 family peptidase [Candidatus Saccharimonadales bacterium]